jgi:hypothetical protein
MDEDGDPTAAKSRATGELSEYNLDNYDEEDTGGASA